MVYPKHFAYATPRYTVTNMEKVPYMPSENGAGEEHTLSRVPLRRSSPDREPSAVPGVSFSRREDILTVDAIARQAEALNHSAERRSAGPPADVALD